MRVIIIIYVKEIIKLIKNPLIYIRYTFSMFDLLFPTHCINCGRPGEYLCTMCQKRLKSSLPECYVCRRISNQYITHPKCNKLSVNSVFIGWEYDSIAKKILSEFKYRYAYKLSEILSELLIKRLKQTRFIDNLPSDSILIPVPIHSFHQNKRGFNQSILISRRLSKALGFDLAEDIIIRKKDRQHQSQATLKKRKDLGDVFDLTHEIKNKNIVIVDDVVTTGTTINRVAKTLASNNINAIALFRGRPRYQ